MDASATFAQDAVLTATLASFDAQVAAGNEIIVLPNTLSGDIVSAIQQRYSQIINGPVTVAADLRLKIIRFMPTASRASSQTFSETTASPESTPVFPTTTKVKIPRPANAFILYRTHHHPIIKARYPDIANNQICKLP
jgi:hypothetical protein